MTPSLALYACASLGDADPQGETITTGIALRASAPQNKSLAAILAMNAALIRRNDELEAALGHQSDQRKRDSKDIREDLDPQHDALSLVLVETHQPDIFRPAPSCIAGLTPRQLQVLNRVLDGQPSKNIAADLCISRRTVENHRAAIMQRSGATSLPALARMAVGWIAAGDHR